MALLCTTERRSQLFGSGCHKERVGIEVLHGKLGNSCCGSRGLGYHLEEEHAGWRGWVAYRGAAPSPLRVPLWRCYSLAHEAATRQLLEMLLLRPCFVWYVWASDE